MIRKYGKLIRDRIPEIIEADGKTARVRILPDAEYDAELKNKLTEEVAEYLESGEPSELADILEVVEALAERQGVAFDELLEIKTEKRRTNGAFRSRLFLESVEDDPQPGLRQSIRSMTDEIAAILSPCAPSVYLYGSAALHDYRFGWSDIDILVLTEKQIPAEQARRLVRLRRELTEREPGNPYYRTFEGGMLSLPAFLTDAPDTVVYWGTTGERIAERYVFDSFCKQELLENGVLLYGEDVRDRIAPPTFGDLRTDVRRHFETIREHGSETGESLYTFGWLLDISRCIYTLRTGKTVAKTKAAEWAMENGLCPDPAALETALRVRKKPELFGEDAALRAYAAHLGSAVQQYADVLCRELEGTSCCT